MLRLFCFFGKRRGRGCGVSAVVGGVASFVAFSKKSYHTKAEVDLCNSDNLCVT